GRGHARPPGGTGGGVDRGGEDAELEVRGLLRLQVPGYASASIAPCGSPAISERTHRSRGVGPGQVAAGVLFTGRLAAFATVGAFFTFVVWETPGIFVRRFRRQLPGARGPVAERLSASVPTRIATSISPAMMSMLSLLSSSSTPTSDGARGTR